MKSAFLLVVLVFIPRADTSMQKRIKTKMGDFLGITEDVTFKGVVRKYTKFLSIPYGEAPIGDLRFKKPIPKQTLQNPYDATFKRPSCPQSFILDFPGLTFSEDCLHLSIFSPEPQSSAKENKGRPVMVFIHGGAFLVGGANLYDADVLSTYGDVIVVLINYRISVFGFLSTSDDVAPGNYGLWDQHLAIKWVHDNIEEFGGDPKRVTIFGQSAGGASVSYQALFPGNKGLFQHVFALSGGPECHWAFNKLPDPSKYASVVGCDKRTSQELVDCLRSKSMEELMHALNNPPVPWYFYGFSPSRDGEFLRKDPEDLLDPGQSPDELEILADVDLLAGVTDVEGGYHVLLTWPRLLGITDMESYRLTKADLRDIVIPKVLEQLFIPKEAQNAVSKALLFQYSDWNDPDNTSTIRDMLIHLSGDYAFVYPTINLTDAHARSSTNNKKTFFYEFTASTPQFVYLELPSWFKGACHGDDLPFLFGLSKRYLEVNGATERCKPSEFDIDTAETLMTMWTNFAKTGNPNEPEPVPALWPEYTAERREYLEISHHITQESVKSRVADPWVSFWLELIPSLLKCKQNTDGVSDVNTEAVDTKHTEL